MSHAQPKAFLKLAGVLFAMVTVLASSLIVLAPAPVQAACAPIPADNGYATYSIKVPASGTYRVWARLYVFETGKSRLSMQVDQTYCDVLVGQNSSLPANKFAWVDYGASTTSKLNLNLSAGTHTIKLTNIDPDVGVTRFMLLSGTQCTPVGFGGNCKSAATIMLTASGGNGAVSSANPDGTLKSGGSSSAGGTSNQGSSSTIDISGNSSTSTNKAGTDGNNGTASSATNPAGKTGSNWQARLVSDVKSHWIPLTAILLLVVLVGSGIGFMLIRRFMSPNHTSRVRSAAKDASIADIPVGMSYDPSSDTPPPSN